jgi:hypothetical protein
VTVAGGTKNYIKAWFDWNKDLDYADAGEAFTLGTNVAAGTYTLNITVPAGASLGKTSFRVINRYNVAPIYCPASSCIDGEIEDYSIYISDGTHCSNGVKDADEIGTDCGGADCALCTDFKTNTGMNVSASDFSEDVTGDSWVNGIAVNAGEIYYLMVNNWSPGAHGFDLIWNFTEGGAMDCSYLPIDLLNFSATCSGKNIQIEWATASETNNAYFSIERSSDAQGWETIAKVDGSGNTNTVKNYAYTDNKPLEGNSYYRLKQTDYDGLFTYSLPVSANCYNNPSPVISYYPNPFNGEVMIDISHLSADKASISIYNILGQEVLNKELQLSGQGNQNFDLNLNALSTGIYSIVFTSQGFENIQKLVKYQ